ncbi:uncharacterized protein LOC134910124 isoform X5 [Pseudophryne corroboree]|uniref:uncharacterized protein LOC134910124 isoform X5 n=1 Tax=Pseudophryne corroboree TaxID=495146 RepID=UPI003081A50E
MEDVTDDSQGNMSTYIRQCSKAAIYLCGKCWRPLGDTQDFVENNVGDCLILLKAVTDQVEIDPRMQVFTLPNEVGSYILGSADNQLMPEGEAPITLYKYDLLEKEMKKSCGVRREEMRRSEELTVMALRIYSHNIKEQTTFTSTTEESFKPRS